MFFTLSVASQREKNNLLPHIKSTDVAYRALRGEVTAVGPVVFARESWLQDGNKTRKYWSLDTNSGLGTVRTQAEQAPLHLNPLLLC